MESNKYLLKKYKEVYLIYDDETNQVSEMVYTDIIKSNYSLDANLTGEEVMEKYINMFDESTRESQGCKVQEKEEQTKETELEERVKVLEEKANATNDLLDKMLFKEMEEI